MLFNSYAFLLIFLPVALAIYAVADRVPRARNPVLLLLSLFFYGYWDIRFLPFLGVSIVANWCVARLFAATQRKALIALAVAGNLLVLGLFKYANFFAANLSALGLPVGPFDLVLPLGISFFTFHHIMYLVDLGRGKAPQVSLERYALYICFFPQVLSGPLVRWYEIMHQFGTTAFAAGWERRVALGAAFVVIGLAQKVYLGDGLATVVNPIYLHALDGDLGRAEAWLAVLGFSFQILFDFAGYTDVAIGLGLLFGLELPRNFNAPYRATSITDFWRRWHMTLSRFLRDYLYIPLGGNRHGLSRQVLALVGTMMLGGLWHGAGWLFVIWGLLHGIALTIALVWRKWTLPMPAMLGWFATFGFVTFAWILFRSPSLPIATHIFDALAFGGPSPPMNGWRTVMIAAFCAIALPASDGICRRLVDKPRLLVAAALGAAGAAILVALGSEGSYEFIYFRF